MKVSVPAEREALRVLRMMASDAGNLMGLSYDQIEDARLAVNEAASVLVSEGGVRAIECRFTSDRGELGIELWAEPAPSVWPPVGFVDSLEQLVLDRVTDRLELVTDGRPGFRMGIAGAATGQRLS
jgi:hypothetical protein